MSEEKSLKTGDESVAASSQGIPSVVGNGAARDSLKKNPYLIAVVIALVAIALGIGFLLWKNSGADQMLEGEAAQSSSSQQSAGGITSSRERTEVKLPPKEKDEQKDEKGEVESSKPKDIPMPIPAAAVGVGADGKPVPTLAELKFAAPMMGISEKEETANSTPVYAQQASLSQGVTAGALGQSSEGGGLGSLLKPTSTPRTGAKIIKEQSMTLSKGTVIECILETRVDTTVPGMTSCVIPRNIYSMNGRVLLVEKGTKAIGEYQGSVQNGLARIFMLWTELRTPKGVSIAINSPTADSLGGAGMGGYVDYHWWKRFGNALMFSMIQDGFQYVVNTANNSTNNGYVTYENTQNGMDEIIKEAMQQSGNIPPTLIKNQGEKVSIFVARDVNFSNVYSLSTQ